MAAPLGDFRRGAPLSAAWVMLLLVVVCSPLAADGKVDEVRIQLGSNGRGQRVDWQLMGKFGFDLGDGSWTVRLKDPQFSPGLAQNATFVLHVFVDDRMPQVEAEPDVCSRGRHASLTERLSVGKGVSGKARQNVRPHVFYWALSDCSQSLGDGSVVVTAEFTALNPDNSHFDVESKWTSAANLWTLLGCTVFLGYFGKRARSFGAEHDSVHPVIWTLLAVLLTQYLAQCLHTGHLQLYRLDGRGSVALEILSELLFVCCQVIQASLLILIASGYTLQQAKLGAFDTVMAVCFLVACVHALLVIHDRSNQDPNVEFTGHEGCKGYGFVLLRVGLFAWFQLASHSTSNAAGMRIRAFLQQFRVLGSFYFLSYPAVLGLSLVLAPYIRRPILEMGLMSSQVCSNAWLAHLFLSRGAFFKASSLSASPLPGGGAATRFYKDD